MRSKTSFFNRTIFQKNITHFWPIWTAYSLFCICSMPVYSYFLIRSMDRAGLTAAQQAYLKVEQAVSGVRVSMNPWIIFAFAILSATAVFSYLYNSRSVNMMHALPVCREELFVTNYLSGLLFLLVPQVTAFLLTVFVWFGNGITHLEYLLQWLGIVSVETFFGYSMGVFCTMLTGNIAVAPIYFILLNYFYKGIWNVWNLVRQALIYGFAGSTEITYGAGMVPVAYLGNKIQIVYDEERKGNLPIIEGMECLKWYILAAVVFIVLALMIYRKRQLECAGDVVAISGVKPVVRWGGAMLCAGLIGEIIQTSFFAEKVLYGEMFGILLVCWLVGGIISFFGIEMIMEKRFMIFSKKRLAESGGFLLVIILFLSCMQVDLFKMEERIPDAEEVAELYVQGSYNRYITGQDKIQENIELQRAIIESREEYQQYFKKYYGKESCNYMTLTLTYIMKDGKKQNWSYYLPLEEYYLNEEDSPVKELLCQEASPEDYMAYYFTEQYGNIDLQTGSYFDGIDEDYNFKSDDIPVEDMEQILEAFQKDLASGNYHIYPYGAKERTENTYVNMVTVCYKPPKGAHTLQCLEEEMDNVANGKYEEYSGIILTKECKNTIAVLEKLGYIDEKHKLMTEKEYEAAVYEWGLY